MASRKYLKHWEQDPSFKEWIQRVPEDDTKAFCKLCKCQLRPHTSDLKLHMKTEKHRKAAARSTSSQQLAAEQREVIEQGVESGQHDQGRTQTSLTKYEPVDTQEQFQEVFKKKEFDSWDEFAIILDEFQHLTGTFFKPKSGSTVEKMNKRRVTALIPLRFRYQTVQMVCQHYGYPQPSPNTKWKRGFYVGLGCQAHFKLSYRQGKLHLTTYDLIHTNHALDPSESRPVSQIPWAMNFTDDLDLLIARTVLEDKVYDKQSKVSDWRGTVMKLQDSDSRLLHVTPRVIKRRVNTLLEKFEEEQNTLLEKVEEEHQKVLPYDELENILQKLLELRKENIASQTSSAQFTGDEEHSYTSSRRRRVPKFKSKFGREYVKRRKSDQLDVGDDDDAAFEIDDSFVGDSNLGAMVVLGVANSAGASPACPEKTRTADKPDHLAGLTNVDEFWAYWQRRDGEEWKLRHAESELRKQEMELRKKELEFQRQKFEFDRAERETLLQLLISQSKNPMEKT